MKFPYRALRNPRYCLTLLLIAFWALFSQLPHFVLAQVARLMAFLMPVVAKRRCYILQKNLALCFPELSEEERKKLQHKNLFHTCLCGLEVGIVAFWPLWRLRNFGELRGAELLTELPTGALILGFHNSTLDTTAAVFHPRLSKGDVTYRRHKNPVFEYFQRRGRERLNGVSKCIEREDVRGAIRSMRQGRWVWYAPDQDFGVEQGVFAPFFGIEAATLTATSRFAKVAKVPVMRLLHYRDERNRCIVQILPPMEGFPSGDDQQDAKMMNEWVESEVRKRPEQYLWVHRRFKTRPPGAPPLYGKYSKRAQKIQ